MKPSEYLTPAPPNYQWPRCPEADQFVATTLRAFLDRHAFAGRLAERMNTETSTLIIDWVDHLLLPTRIAHPDLLATLGYVEDRKVARPTGMKVYVHPFADLPRFLVGVRIKEPGCAVMVDDLWRFQLAHGLSEKIQGAPYSAYRFIRLAEGAVDFYVVERRGSLDFVPERQGRGERYRDCFEQWVARPRHFLSETDGMKQTLQLARTIARSVGTGPAATLFLEGERIYWQKRNHAAQTQKARQDTLGLGWANHDHHTFRSSRQHFPMLINILLAFGFKKRERYYAGEDAGWGAQIMEQPEAGLIIFADVDLSPTDVEVDFSKVALSELAKPRTVGLWCALHGDSMLQAGMHHLEAKFDFDLLRQDLREHHIESMPPFSDFPFLRQAFTKAEMWPVASERLDALRVKGRLSAEGYEQIKKDGAVGSHMENLQRHDGFKGFNRQGVSHIIAAVNPEKLALEKRSYKEGA